MIFSFKNKKVFAETPSVPGRYNVMVYLGQRKYFRDVYFISGKFITKTGYLFSI